MIETFVDLQEAYKRKKEELDLGRKEWKKRVYRERREQDICVDCGKKELTKSEKERGLVRCRSCRYKARKRK